MIWTIPNILTMLRLLAAPGVALMFLYFSRPWADWCALAIFIAAAATDWFDGYLARAWKQQSRFGTMLDPIADKVMVVIAILVIVGHAGMNAWLFLPVTVILFREICVSGLREFLGERAGLLKVTKLAKWKTTAQMIAIAILFLGTGLEQVHLNLYAAMSPDDYQNALEAPDWNAVSILVEGAWYAGFVGIVLIWIAALLTAVTGWDYFNKALPFLKDECA